MTDLTAVDILINPDEGAVLQARALNERMRRSVADGFALDANHAPHITTLQRFVRTADLDQMFEAVEKTIVESDVSALTLRAIAIRHADWGVPGQGLAVLQLQPHAAVLDYQARLLAALSPYVESGGTAAAFVTDADDPDISQTTIDWVEGYVPGQLGEKYVPHITVGFATLDDLQEIEDAPFDAFDVHPASVAVYHLGNNGTARRQLKAWPLSP
jgi:2'-5' RNA ligase